MDAAKNRMVAAIGAGIFGTAALFLVSVALTAALSAVMSPIWAYLTLASVYATIACICAVIFLNPSAATVEEIEEIETATASALAELPFDTIKALIEQRPIAAMVMAATAGYTISRDPDGALMGIQRAMRNLL